MTLFQFQDYKQYVRDRIQRMPQGRGEFRKMALFLRVHTTLISQIFKGPKDLTFEQAGALTEYLSLTELEAEFFVTLVERARAGTPTLRKIIERRLERLRTKAAELGDRLPQDRQLSPVQQAIFYSNWDYSAVRLATSLPGLRSTETLATALGLPRSRVAEILEFLLSNQLVVREENQDLCLGPARTHVRSDSPFVVSHHRNWRLKALSLQENAYAARRTGQSADLAFTAPVTLSQKDFEQVREELVALIDSVSRRVVDSDPQVLACFTLDWAQVVRSP